MVFSCNLKFWPCTTGLEQCLLRVEAEQGGLDNCQISYDKSEILFCLQDNPQGTTYETQT